MTTQTQHQELPALFWLGVDAAVVLLFLVVGRETRGDGVLGLLENSWPFMVGLGVAWLVTRAWRNPRRVLWTGIIIWLVTITVGMLLRLATMQSVQSSFVFASVIGLGAFLLGWRGVVWILDALFGKVPDDENDA